MQSSDRLDTLEKVSLALAALALGVVVGVIAAAPLQGKIVMVFTPTNLTIKRAPDQVLVWATDIQTGGRDTAWQKYCR